MKSPSCGRVACLVIPALQDQGAWEKVLEILAAHSPLVEEGSLMAVRGASAYLDASGVAPRYGSEEAWCRAILDEISWAGVAKNGPEAPRSGESSSPLSHEKPCAHGHGRGASARTRAPGEGGAGRIGVAGSKYAAWVAAQTAPADPGYQVVTQPDRCFLAPLPAGWLPLSAEVQRRLQMLGIWSISRFAALPPSAVAEQFTPDSLEIHRWARGLDDRPVIGRRCQVVQAHRDFEAPENRREALVEVAARLSYRALEDLPVSPRAWAVKRIELQATLSEGESVQRSVWLDDTPGQQTLRTLLGDMVDSLTEDLPPGRQGRRGLFDENLGALGDLVGSPSSEYACQGVVELTVKLLGLEPAQGRQMDLFASIETRRRLEQTLQQLAQKHASCVALVVALDVEAPILEERYAFVVQAAYPVAQFS